MDLVLDERKPKWVFQRADRIGAAAVVLLAEEEVRLTHLCHDMMRFGVCMYLYIFTREEDFPAFQTLSLCMYVCMWCLCLYVVCRPGAERCW